MPACQNIRPLERQPVDIFLPPGGFHFGGGTVRLRTLLGSCVAITMWHPRRRIGGMCHFLLPERAAGGPAGLDGRYGKDAVQLFLDAIARAGTVPAEYEVKLLGGGRMFDSRMDIGQRNIEAAHALLGRLGLRVHAGHLAGSGHRHVVFDIASGLVWLKHVREPAIARKVA